MSVWENYTTSPYKTSTCIITQTPSSTVTSYSPYRIITLAVCILWANATSGTTISRKSTRFSKPINCSAITSVSNYLPLKVSSSINNMNSAWPSWNCTLITRSLITRWKVASALLEGSVMKRNKIRPWLLKPINKHFKRITQMLRLLTGWLTVNSYPAYKKSIYSKT